MRRMVLIGVVALACAITLAGFVSVVRGPLLMAPASPRMEYWNGLFMQIFWIALVVGVLVWALLIYALIRFRARKDGPKEGPHIHGNTKMEIAWTIAPALVMGWLLVVSFNGLFEIEGDPERIDTTIQIEASQFQWTFRYEDGTSGTAPGEAIFIEQNKFIKFEITSTDVIHAFSVPELGLMKDAIPGRTNYDWVQPTKVGSYGIKCRELCGAGHSYMLGNITVFPEGERGGKAYGPAVPVGPSPSPGANTTSPTPTQTGNATSTSVPTDAETVELQLSTSGFNIEPATIKVDVGTVVFNVRNAGDVKHNLFIGKFDASKPVGDHGALWKSSDLAGGQSEPLVAMFDQNETYEYWCDIPGHRTAPGEGMSGFLTVGEGGELDLGPKPLLPGFEALALVFAVAAIAFAFRRRA